MGEPKLMQVMGLHNGKKIQISKPKIFQDPACLVLNRRFIRKRRIFIRLDKYETQLTVQTELTLELCDQANFHIPDGVKVVEEGEFMCKTAHKTSLFVRLVFTQTRCE